MGQTLSEPIVDKVSVACTCGRSLLGPVPPSPSLYLPTYPLAAVPSLQTPLLSGDPTPSPRGLSLRALAMLFAVCARVGRVPHPPRSALTGLA